MLRTQRLLRLPARLLQSPQVPLKLFDLQPMPLTAGCENRSRVCTGKDLQKPLIAQLWRISLWRLHPKGGAHPDRVPSARSVFPSSTASLLVFGEQAGCNKPRRLSVDGGMWYVPEVLCRPLDGLLEIVRRGDVEMRHKGKQGV